MSDTAGSVSLRAGGELLVARQPILDRNLDPHGYELLCRLAGAPRATGSVTGHAQPGGAFPDGVAAQQATAAVIARSFLTLGLHTVTGGKPAYVNVDADLVVRGGVAALPRDVVVLELGRDLDASDPAVTAALGELRRKGYRLLLDQVVRGDDPRLALLDFVDGAKLDFATGDAGTRSHLAGRVLAAGVRLYAGKVETQAHAAEAFALGCEYVQGYFFAEPLVLSRRQPPGFRPTHLRLLEAIGSSELDFAGLEEIIKSDVLLSHQFLRYINVAHFGWRRTITSLRHAFVLLGEDQVRQWVSLVVMADLAQDKPQQLAVTACLRARFCELLAGHLPGLSARRLDLYLLGMFSLIDAILDRPMVAALSGMPLPVGVTAALLGRPSDISGPLAVVRAYERGDWPALERLCAEHGVDEAALYPSYLRAVEWVSGIFDSGDSGDPSDWGDSGDERAGHNGDESR